MKSLFQLSLFVLTALLFTQCTKDDGIVEPAIEATILGEWAAEGSDNTRYHFTETLHHRVYKSGDEEWPTLAEWTAESNGALQWEWQYEGDVVAIDLNFGNISRITPEFRCGNQVIQWIQEDGSAGEKYYRPDHDLSSCN